jgi:hypothetical protein
MEISTTITIDELQDLIENAVYKATTSLDIGDYKLITENELSKRLNISKVTLGKYRKEGTIPYIRIGSTIRYNYPKVIKERNNKK